MKKIENVIIIGMGALGVLFGQTITKSLGRKTVCFAADSRRILRYEKEGVYCNGEKCDFSYINPADTDKTADLLIFAVKSAALGDAISLAENVVREDTIIMSLLNGISSEEIIASKLGRGRILHCVAQGMDAVKLGNKLTYGHPGELRIGIGKSDIITCTQPEMDVVVDFLKRSNIPFEIEPDIIRRMWGKWMLNVGLNQVVMLYEGTYATVQKPGEARNMMIQAMREVISLAHAEHVDIGESDLENYVELTDSLSPDGMPSMRQDGLLGRKTEVDLFAGTVIKKAEKDNVDVPVNRELYRKITAIESTFK